MMPPMQRPSVKRPSGRACASFRSRPKSSRQTASCSEPAICWCVSAPSASTLFAGTLWNTAMSFRRASPMLKPLSPWSRTYSPHSPDSVRVILKLLVDTFTALEAQITALDVEINQRSKSDPTARRLMTIPVVGPIASTAITALVPAAEGFPAGRDFAAWLGLTPLQKSTGGKQKLGAVSKRGERTIRRLLIIGASAVVQEASRRGAPKGSWLAQMLARKPKMLVTVALANKMARIIWALLVKGGTYRTPAAAA